jgi:hypothetical protein
VVSSFSGPAHHRARIGRRMPVIDTVRCPSIQTPEAEIRANDTAKLLVVFKSGSILACIGYLGLAMNVLRQVAEKDHSTLTKEQELRQDDTEGPTTVPTPPAEKATIVLNYSWQHAYKGSQEHKLYMCNWVCKWIKHLCGVECPPELIRKECSGLRAGFAYFLGVPAEGLVEEVEHIVTKMIVDKIVPTGHVTWNMAKFVTARLLRSEGGAESVNAGRTAFVTAVCGCVDDLVVESRCDYSTDADVEQGTEKDSVEKEPTKKKKTAKKSSKKRKDKPKTASKQVKEHQAPTKKTKPTIKVRANSSTESTTNATKSRESKIKY